MVQRQVTVTGLVLASVALVILVVLSAAGTGVQAAPQATPTLAPIPDPVRGAFDPASVAAIDLADIPIVPETISEQARLLYLDGLARGNNPRTFAKVGDCMTDNPFFLVPIGEGEYDLGEYEELQPVIDRFIDGDLNSFARKSQAAAGGFNASSILDSMWANPEFCEAGETPLGCEFRIMQPSIAVIMFGTNDVFYLDEASYDYFLRAIVAETKRNGVLPILSTFPLRPEFPEKSELYNKIVVKIAQDYDVPLINLWRALDPLPNAGVDEEDTTHLSTPKNGFACHFIDENLQAGFTVRNLVTLQALDAVLKAVEEPGIAGE